MTTTANLLDSVKASELSMIFEGRNVVCLGGFNGGREKSEVKHFPIDTNSGAVFSFANGYAFHPGFAVGVDPAIPLILGTGRLSHVLLSAIESVSAYVVNAVEFESRYQLMKENHRTTFSTLRYGCHCIKSVSRFCGMPLKTAYDISVIVVDKCILALRKFYLNHINIVQNFSVTETTPTGTKNRRKTVAKEAS